MASLKAHHPGAVLRDEFMEPVGLTPYKLAKALEVPLPRVNDIVLEKRSISAEMGLLLSAYFGTTDQYWINLQADYHRRLARSRIEKKLKSIKRTRRTRTARSSAQPESRRVSVQAGMTDSTREKTTI